MPNIESYTNRNKADSSIERKQTDFEIHREIAHRMLDEADFETMGAIFSERRRRAGVAEKFAPERKDIEIQEWHEGDTFATRYTGGKIVIRIPNIPIPQRAVNNAIFSGLLHEETHSVGKNGDCSVPKLLFEWFKSRFLGETKLIQESGYSKALVSGGRVVKEFISFNEGVTDMIAGDVYEEYMHRTGNSQTFAEPGSLAEYSEGYLGARYVITAFVEIVAQESGVSSEKVREAIVHGYMKGLDLNSTTLRESFEEIFSPAFLEALRKSESGEDVPNMEVLMELIRHELPDAALNRINESLKKYEQFLKETDV